MTPMIDLFTQGLFLPTLGLAVIAWIVPKLLSMILPAGVKPLFLNAFLSTLMLVIISAGYFVFLYLARGFSLSEIGSFGWISNISFFGRLALISGLIWAPIMILSVANLPRHWTKATW
jgi:hypothetical protein